MMAPQKPVAKLRGAPQDPQVELVKAFGEMAERMIEALEAIADQMDLISLVVKRHGEKERLISKADFEEEAPHDGNDQT